MGMICLAPFESLGEHAVRAASEEPYSDEFIKRCRDKAQEYDREEWPLRTALLRELKPCIPRHFQGEVFAGITLPDFEGR
jgi:hypothetical protein